MFVRPGLNVVDCISLNAKFRGKHTAFVCGEERASWIEFSQRANKAANALLRAGLKKGDKVCLLCLSSIDAAAVLFGTMLAGGVVVPLSLLLTPDQIAHLARDAGAKFFFVFSPVEPLLNPVLDRLDFIPKENLVSVGFEDERYKPLASFQEGASEGVPAVTLDDDDEACLIYSSGTTGAPKGIIHTHLSRALFAFSMAIMTDAIEPNGKTIAATPLFANTSWGTIMPTMMAGGTSILMVMFNPGDFLKIAQQEKATATLMVPTQYQAVIDHPDFDQYDLSSLRFLGCAGATLPLPLKKRIIEKFGNILVEAYGVTEGVATGIAPEFVLEKPTSVGTPVFGADIRIVDDRGHELPPGEVGEVVGYSHWFMKGYHNNPEATAEMVWLDERGRTFLRTGDMGWLDEDGFLYIADRKRDMIVSGGLNVFAVDIENVLREHVDVQDTAVIAVPHEKWGETPLALVIPRPGATISEEQLMAWANDKMAKFQRIGRMEFRTEDFPRNALGKVLKRVLREPYWQDQG